MSASSAAAADNDVWLWACHGPQGQPLGLGDRFSFTEAFDAGVVRYGDECGTEAAEGFQGGGLLAELADGNGDQAVEGTSLGASYFNVPPGLRLSKVTLVRHTSGLGGAQAQPANPQRYRAWTANSTLESIGLADAAHADVDGEKTFDVAGAPSGDQLRVGVLCDTASPSTDCSAASPVSVQLNRVGMLVTEPTSSTDDGKPDIAVGGLRNPASGVLELDVQATDAGSGLRSAEAWIGNGAHDTQSFGGTDCEDLTPNTATVDMALDAECPKVGAVSLRVDTTQVGDGDRVLTVRVVDWSGKEEVRQETLSVLNHVNLGSPTQTLSIGTSGITTQPTTQTPGTSTGGVAGAGSTSCRVPRLSMFLAQKPVRVSKGVPVLRRAKRYRFNGRLTCEINGKRRSAPKRTRIDILNTIGRKTVEKGGVTTRDKGNITVILAYKTSRTLIFRFTNSDGQRSQVRIKIRVTKKR